jgi:hypothetical protein
MLIFFSSLNGLIPNKKFNFPQSGAKELETYSIFEGNSFRRP